MFFIDENPKSVLAEKYRNLRTSIEYSSVDKELKSIVITSSEPGEGKSTVATNLAYILGKSNKKVVIIDCDFRKPTIHRKYEISNAKGITEYLTSKSELSEVIQELEYGISVITTGILPPNPAEVIASKAMINFIDELKEIYDFVIIDTPPVRVVTDAVILAGKCDATLFVVKANSTKDISIRKGYGELKKVKANVIGAVINEIEPDSKDYGYYGYSEAKRKDKKKKV